MYFVFADVEMEKFSIIENVKEESDDSFANDSPPLDVVTVSPQCVDNDTSLPGFIHVDSPFWFSNNSNNNNQEVSQQSQQGVFNNTTHPGARVIHTEQTSLNLIRKFVFFFSNCTS